METTEELKNLVLNPLELEPEKNMQKYLLKDNKLHLDSTRISDFANCERSFYFRHILGLEGHFPKAAPNFGSVIHEFLAEYYNKTPEAECWNVLEEAFIKFEIKDTPGILYNQSTAEDIIRAYIELYGEDKEIKVLKTEIAFDDIDLYTQEELSLDPTIFPVVLAGRMDILGYYKNFTDIAVIDHKTTRFLGDTYIDQFRLRWQTSIYIIAAIAYYGSCAGFVSNTIFVGKTKRDFIRYHTRIPDYHLKNVISWIKLWGIRIKKAIDTTTFLPNYSHCHVYGSCMFRDICSCEIKDWKNLIRANFTTRLWDPSD